MNHPSLLQEYFCLKDQGHLSGFCLPGSSVSEHIDKSGCSLPFCISQQKPHYCLCDRLHHNRAGPALLNQSDSGQLFRARARHTHIHTHTYTHIHMQAYTHTHACIHTHVTYTHIHSFTTHIHILTHAEMHTSIHTCIHTKADIYTYMYTHIHTHTYTYIYMQICTLSRCGESHCTLISGSIKLGTLSV